MKKRIVVYGPPGSGKSTMVKLALMEGIEAYNLEDLGVNREDRKIVLEKLLEHEKSDFVIYISADVKIEDFPSGTKSVLLLPEPKEEYIKRMEERNRIKPRKAGQNELHWYDEHAKWKHLYDLVITEISTPEETFKKILNLANNW